MKLRHFSAAFLAAACMASSVLAEEAAVLRLALAEELLGAAQQGKPAPGNLPVPQDRPLTTAEVISALQTQAGAVRWTPERLKRFIADMPKVETHLHLDGSLTPETIQSLARRQNYAPLRDKSLGEIRALAVVNEPRESLAKVLDAFKTIYPLLYTPEAVERMAYDCLANAAKDNIRYVEVRFAPALQAKPDFSVNAVVEAALKGLKRAERDFPVKSGLIISLYRPLSKEQNEAMLQAAVRYEGQGVVGIDLAGDEAQHPLTEFKDFFKRAKEAGLRLTVHAGEVPGSKDLSTALDIGVDRISHATLLANDPEMTRKIAAQVLPIEVNLTSNLRTGAILSYDRHPVKDWIRSGVPVSLSTDDPGVFGITLSGEYNVLAGALGLTPDQIIAVQVGAIDSLFLSDADKDVLRAQFLAQTRRLLR